MKNEENKKHRNSISDHILQNFFSKYNKFIDNANKKNSILIQIYSLYSELYTLINSFVKKINDQTDHIFPKEYQKKDDYFYCTIKLINKTLETTMKEDGNLLKDLLHNLKSLLNKTKIENQNLNIELKSTLIQIEEEKKKLEMHKKSFQISSEKVESDVLQKLIEAHNKNESFNEALKSNDLFKELKINYINYNSSLEKVNKIIRVCNNIQKSVLNMYSDFNSKYFEFTNNILNFFYANQSIKENLISKNKKDIKEMTILNNNNVLNCNKIKEIRENHHKNLVDLIQYENFQSKINFLNIQSNDEFNRCIYTIELFRKNLDANIYPNISIEKEKERNKEREKMFNLIKKGNNNISNEDKNELYTLLKKDDYYQKLFLSILNKVRIDGKFMKYKEFITMVADVFNIIIDTSEMKKDYDAVKHCIILSQTFYYEDDKKQKIYIIDLIKNSKWLHNTDFWRNYIDLLIIKEFIKYQNIHKEKDFNIFMKNNISDKSQDKIGELLFSQLMPSVNNMIELNVEKKIIARVCEEFINKYNYLNQNNIDILYSLISQDSEEINNLREEAKREISLKFTNMNGLPNNNINEKKDKEKERNNENKEVKENKKEIIVEKKEIQENKNDKIKKKKLKKIKMKKLKRKMKSKKI
jgi:hypothetical protein